MAVKFNLVGLINFFDLGRDGKLLLIPDGTNPPGPGHIPQHFAGIFVLARQVLTHAEWPSADDDPDLQQAGVLHLPISEPCTISISGMSNGVVESTEHDRLVPVLKRIDPNFDIVPAQAETIAQIPIHQGKFEAFVFGRDSVVSQLTIAMPAYDPVAQQGSVMTIQATAADGSTKAFILSDGAEIVIANISKLGTAAGAVEHPEDSHFRIYSKLDVARRADGLIEPRPNASLEQIASAHPYLSLLRDRAGEFPSPGCSVTG
jgi:hypothetical protein